MAMAVALLLLVLAAPTVYGADHTVGGSQQWDLGVNYSTWAAGETFSVGDNLVFNYGSSHGVYEVNKADYDSCSSSSPIQKHSSSPTTIPLTAAGTQYFLCPTTGHCQGGMKLAVVVAASGGSPPTSPSSPPSSTPASPPPPTPTTSPTPPANSPPPPPPNNGAGGRFTSVSTIAFGSAAVLATILGFM